MNINCRFKPKKQNKNENKKQTKQKEKQQQMFQGGEGEESRQQVGRLGRYVFQKTHQTVNSM